MAKELSSIGVDVAASPDPAEAIQQGFSRVTDSSSQDVLGAEREAIIEQFLAELRAGKPVSVDAYCLRFPDPSGELRSLLSAAEWMERCRDRVVPEVADANSGDRSVLPLNLGEFRIVREIGHGAMGIVYEAIQAPLGRRVALKILAPRDKPNPILVERFRREAQVASRLHHTNIVPVHGAGEADGQLFYAMQFIDGQSLLEWLPIRRATNTRQDTAQTNASSTYRDEPPVVRSSDFSLVPNGPEQGCSAIDTTVHGITAREVARIGREIAQAIHHAHLQQILHRDIKPSNILIDTQGRAWITDFGLAKPTESPDLTGSGDLVGTLRYMAPERFRGECDVTSDIYSLGATLYEALLGRPVITGMDGAHIIAELSKGRQIQIPASESTIPTDLRTIVNKAIRLTPSDRYSSAAALADDLARFLDNRPITARRASTIQRVILWSRRNPWLARLSASLAAVIVTGLLGLALLWQRSETLRIQAESNLHESQTNLQLAIAAVDQFCDKVSDDLRLSQHDLRPLRRQLLQTAVEFHRKLLDRRGHSRGSRLDLARAYARLGRLSAEIDSRDEPRHFLQQAKAAFAELLEEEPNNAPLRLEYAQCASNLACLLESTGEEEQAEQNHLLALKLMDGVPLSAPDDRLTRSNLLGRLSNFYRRHRRVKEAEAPQLESLAICEELHTAHPEEDSYRAVFVEALIQVGEYYQFVDLRRWREAEGIYRRALAAQKPLVRAPQPPSERWGTMARIHYNLGRIYRLSARHAEAERSFGESIAILRQLAADHPSVIEHYALLAQTLNALGELLVEYQGYEQAAQPWQEARAILQRLTSIDPSNNTHRLNLGEAEMNAGELAVAEGNIDEALASFNQACKILRGVLRDTPDLSRASFYLMALLERRAKLYESQFRFQDAAADWEESTLFAEPLLRPWFQAQAAICNAKAGNHVHAAELAEELATSLATAGKGHGQSHWEAAKALALACRAAREDSKLSDKERSDLANRYASRAVAVLADVLATDAMDPRNISSTEEFAALHEYEPFQKLLAGAK